MVSGIVSAGAAAAKKTEPETIFKDEFSSDSLDSSLWESHGETIENGAMLLSNGNWPTLKMPILDTDSAYRFSHKVMGTGTGGSAAHELLKVMHSDAAGNGRSFGSYRPGYGFTFKSINWSDDWGYSGTDVTANNVWYTVETEFCEKEGERYTKWTVKDESGRELYTDATDGLWNAYAGTETTASVSGEKIWFYNNAESMALNIYVDDVMLEKIDKSNVMTKVLFEQNFDNVCSIEKLTEDGVWTRPADVGILDGALEIQPNGYIYFDIKNKNNNTAYKMSYDIMTPAKGNGKGGLNVFAEGNTSWSLGFFNSVQGFAGIKHSYDDPARVILGTAAGTWYTVKAEFCENAASGYIIYTLIDRNTQKIIGTYAPDNFEAMDSSRNVADNHTHFCFWNREGSDETYYIDNIKVEIQGEKPVFREDAIIIRDIAGNEITDITSPITPGVAEIVLDFSAEVTAESVKDGVCVAEIRGNGEEATVEIEGALDGSKYTLSFNEILKENAKYIIKISKTITTEGGDTLPNDCRIEFSTDKASCTVEPDGIYAKNIMIDSVGKIGSNVPVTVKAKTLNTTSDEKKMVVCVSYFDGSRMVATSLAAVNIVALSGGMVEKTLMTPDNLEYIDSVQVVFWNNVSEMLPYCGSILLSR